MRRKEIHSCPAYAIRMSAGETFPSAALEFVPTIPPQ